MRLVCLSLHHIKIPYADFLGFYFKNPAEFYRLFSDGKTILFQSGTRIEVYALVEEEKEIDDILEVLYNERRKEFLIYYDEKAVEHLMRLVGGIESKVYGETYIPRLVKSSLDCAEKNSTLHPFLKSLFKGALKVSQRAWNETNIGGSPTVEKLVLSSIQKEFQTFEGRIVILLGAGLLGRRIAKKIRKLGAEIAVAHRHFDIAKLTAAEVGGRSILYRDLMKAVEKADLLICATLASHNRLTPDMLIQPCNITIADVSPFGNVDPEVTKITGVKLLSSIRSAVLANMEIEKNAVPDVENIVKEEVEKMRKIFKWRYL
jgi:glutamyl-tRNA reductase